MIQWMLAIWSLVLLTFLNPDWMSESLWFTYCWSLAWRILSITLLACESESEVAQSCLTLCDPMDYSPPGFSVHGIFQARILEWVAISFSRRSSRPRDWTQVSRIIGRCFTVWATREVRTQKIQQMRHHSNHTWELSIHSMILLVSSSTSTL